MDDSFELEYADDLDAIDDFIPDVDFSSHKQPKSKKSLKFETPKRISASKNSIDDKINGGDNDIESDPLEQYNIEDFQEISSNNSSRKRTSSNDWTLNDDIDGSLSKAANVISPFRKKQRLLSNDELDEEISDTARLIEQIQQHRQKAQDIVQNSDLTSINKAEDLERPRVSKHILKGDFVSTVGYDGQRVFMRLLDEESLEAEYHNIANESRSNSLLTVPVSVMREKMEEEVSQKIFQETLELEENLERQLQDLNSEKMDAESIDIDDNRITANMKENESVEELTTNMKSLWVEKYAPQRYTDLLSEESINRRLLHWLKLWDFVVFGKDVPKKNKNVKNEKENDFKKFKKFQAEVEEDLDQFNRPQQLIALLCGPPGLGKTTLAHIVATHAGYNVVEMNASDDRSADVFRTKLENATQMKSVSGADNRPNCLVIDEIDGAPLPAINTLLNKLKKSDKEKTSKKKKDGGLMLRPIICVCNDQYVPALRQLRQMALILNFPQTEPSRLASRLFEVVRVEHLKADLNALLALCERTDNDIRSCLNTLQFVRQKQKELTLKDVHTMSIGQKDSHKSTFSVWSQVFTMPRPKKNRFISIQDLASGKQESLNNDNISNTARFWNILELCQSAGESQRVMQGLHENYLESKSKDPYLSGLVLANEWICYCDCFNQYTARSQDYSVMKFTNFLPIVFHFLYASKDPPRVQFPQSQSEANQQVTKTQNLITSLVSDMSPIVRKFCDPRNMVLDLLPPLLDVLQPNLRPVNAQLYSAREKAELANVVNIMIHYNMTYHQEKSLEGQYEYILDPNVEDVVKFSGLKQRKQLTYAAKQMIAREIDLEKMRKSEGSKSIQEPAEKVSSPKKSSVPNHLRKLEAKAVKEEKPAINFFGNFTRTKRVKEVKPNQEPKEDLKKKSLLDTLVWFHFKEGFSNAVRRSVKVQDLL